MSLGRTGYVPSALIALTVFSSSACAPGAKARARASPAPEPSAIAGSAVPLTAAEPAAQVGRPLATTSREVHVPRARHRLNPSAHFDVKLWQGAFQTHTLLDAAGNGAVPVSEARLLWRHDALYLRFYAGDLDLQVHSLKPDGPTWKDDSLTLAVYLPDASQRRISVSATGVVADGSCPRDAGSLEDPRCDLRWQSHARVGFDYDGSLNQLDDHDEEWNIELALPLRSLGVSSVRGAHLLVALGRCEIAYDGSRACGLWGSESAPMELVLG